MTEEALLILAAKATVIGAAAAVGSLALSVAALVVQLCVELRKTREEDANRKKNGQ